MHILAVLLVFSSVGLAFPGCSSEDGEGCRNDAQCATGARCLLGECRSACSGSEDCDDPQICSIWNFEDESEGAFCSELSGRFTTCESDDACDAQAGFGCVEGRCTIACQSHADCASVGHCSTVGTGRYCVLGEPRLSGRTGATCPAGPADCDAEAGFLCWSSGEGDLDSYCTTDCASDAECPSGFRCGTRRTVPCEAACGISGDASRPDCAPVADIGDGLRYACGVLAVVQRVCERRDFCSPCERDDDCLGVPGQICAKDESGERICTVPCAAGADSCPWGNAAQCGVWDPERGFATCSHRFGSCRGTGQGCEPCISDQDCGTQGICSAYPFSGERYCIDLTAHCDCGSDADANGTCLGHGCPDSPGGLPMTCLQSRFARDPLGERCFGASTSSASLGGSRQAACWPR